jgi:hypothetical protein
VDSIYQPDLIFQMTVRTDKDVLLEGLGVVTGKVSPPAVAGYMKGATHRFFVAVPDTRFNSFNKVHIKADGSAWPPSIAGRIFKLLIPVQTSERTRQEWILAAENKLQAQNVEAAARRVVIGHAATKLPVDTSDMAELVNAGMQKVARRPAWGKELMEVTVGQETIKIYKTFTGNFAYKMK